ncbi:hypothetical protein EXIGLDRAFT_722144 [Exidia glandulosa HHB12029]|uniref:Uncharacterized protein n=1 Tax=Exidia glandulosa HHB12029 TaxID=1314781 RepID=A0A165FF54_EXIGL|nr:hypothetical protein EXIGLDRAFT_722144 [Exidia glandulosa HHB12029]
MDPQTDDAHSDWTEVSYKKPRPNRDRRNGGRNNVSTRSPPAKKGFLDASSARPARPGSSNTQQPRAFVSAEWPKPGESRVQSKAGVAAREVHPLATVAAGKVNVSTRGPATSGAAGNGQPVPTPQRKGETANESASISNHPSGIALPASQHHTSTHSVARGPPAPALTAGQSLSAPSIPAPTAPSLLFSPAPSNSALADTSQAEPLSSVLGDATPTRRSGWDETASQSLELTPSSESSTPGLLLSPPATPRPLKTHKSSFFRRRASSASLSSSTNDSKETTLSVDDRTVIDADESDGRVAAVVRYMHFGTIARSADRGPDKACILVFEFTFSPLPGERFDGATVTIYFQSLDSQLGGRNVVVEAVEPHKLVRDDEVQTTVHRLAFGSATIGAQLPGGASTEAVKLQKSKESSFVKLDWKTARGNGVGTRKAKFVYEQNKADKSGIETSSYAAVVLSCPGGPFELDMSMEITCPGFLTPNRLSHHGKMCVGTQASIGQMPPDVPFHLDTDAIGFMH